MRSKERYQGVIRVHNRRRGLSKRLKLQGIAHGRVKLAHGRAAHGIDQTRACVIGQSFLFEQIGITQACTNSTRPCLY